MKSILYYVTSEVCQKANNDNMLLLHDLASANVFQEDIEINFHEKIT